MHSYWDMNAKDRAALTIEGIEFYVPHELMLAGVVLLEMPELEEEIQAGDVSYRSLDRKAIKERNYAAFKRYSDSAEAAYAATKEMYDDWHHQRAKEKEVEEANTVYNKYLELCGGIESEALKYLFKAFSEEHLVEITKYKSPLADTLIRWRKLGGS